MKLFIYFSLLITYSAFAQTSFICTKENLTMTLQQLDQKCPTARLSNENDLFACAKQLLGNPLPMGPQKIWDRYNKCFRPVNPGFVGVGSGTTFNTNPCMPTSINGFPNQNIPGSNMNVRPGCTKELERGPGPKYCPVKWKEKCPNKCNEVPWVQNAPRMHIPSEFMGTSSGGQPNCMTFHTTVQDIYGNMCATTAIGCNKLGLVNNQGGRCPQDPSITCGSGPFLPGVKTVTSQTSCVCVPNPR